MVKVVTVMLQCRATTRYGQFNEGLSYDDMKEEIQKCNSQIKWAFNRFEVSIVL